MTWGLFENLEKLEEENESSEDSSSSFFMGTSGFGSVKFWRRGFFKCDEECLWLCPEEFIETIFFGAFLGDFWLEGIR